MKWRSLDEEPSTIEPGSLRELFDKRQVLIAKYVPADVQSIHVRVVSELNESGIAGRAVQTGLIAPKFDLCDQNGKLVQSADFLRAGPLVISFFRGRWCPFCVGQLELMNAIYPKFQDLGASLVAISPQTVHQSYLMADQHHLRFSILSDTGNKVARQFGLTYRVPEYQQQIYERAFVRLPFVNGDPGWELPIPATYILDREGRVLYAAANPDYTQRPEPADILQFLSQLAD